MIEGVQAISLVTHSDERGFFRELIRADDPTFKEGFGQWSHTKTFSGAAKAWHIHQRQTDWWYVAIGTVRAVLYDARADSPTHGRLEEHLMGEAQGPQILKIPPGVAHGYKVLEGPAHLFYITSQVYDPSDEGRIPYDDPTIGYDWTKGPDIK